MADDRVGSSIVRESLKSPVVKASGSRRRQHAVAIAKERRESLLRAKRFCRAPPNFSNGEQVPDEDTEDDEMEDSQQEISLFTSQIRSSIDELKSSFRSQNKGVSQKRVEALRKLRRLMTKSAFKIDEAILNSEIIPGLVQCLSFGSSSEQLLESAWCLTNIAAGNPSETRSVLPSVPLLIAHLGDQSLSHVAEQCAWAIGNVASEGEELRNILLSQGALQPLARMLLPHKSSSLRTSAWALSNLLKGPDAKAATELLKIEGILEALHGHLKKDDVESAAEICWLIANLTALSRFACTKLVEFNFLPLLVHHLASSESNELLIPALRSLGNIISNETRLFSSDPRPNEELSGSIIEVVEKSLRSKQPALEKEAAWTVSNIAAGHVENKRRICKGRGFGELVRLLKTAPLDTRKEAGYALGNVCVDVEEGGGKGQIVEECLVEVVRSGCVAGFVSLAKCVEMEAAMMGLQFLELVLRGLPNEEGVRAVEAHDGLEAIERFEFHDNAQLRAMATALIDTYYAPNSQIT